MEIGPGNLKWRDKPIEELSREELIECVYAFANELAKYKPLPQADVLSS